jgi:ankyrin repeat protein
MIAISRRLKNRRRSRVGGRPEASLFDAINKKNIEKIEEILKDNPNAVFEEDENGALPLHRAFYVNLDNKIFAKIFDANPEAAQKKDNDGNYPMHHITDSGAMDSFNQTLNAKLLYNAHPNSVWEKNNDKEDPMQIAIGWSMDTIFITFLYAARLVLDTGGDLNQNLKETAEKLLEVAEPEKKTKHEKAVEPEKETKHEKAAEPEKKKGWFTSLIGKKGGKQSRRRNLRK